MNIETRPQKFDYKTMLADVRHSWRIVASYQQRLFFMLRQLEAGFPELTLSYWEPAMNARPPRGTTKPWEKWSWDFLPLYNTYNWFTPLEATTRSPLDIGNWFMVATILTDTGFDSDGGQSASFSGPDPMKMEAVEDTETCIYLSIYQVTGESKSFTPADIWNADAGEDTEKFEWVELPEVGARFTRISAPLENCLEDGAMDQLIAELRARLVTDGLQLKEPTGKA